MTTIDHEIGNARKRLREGFLIVALVTAEERATKTSAAFDPLELEMKRFFESNQPAHRPE